MSEEAEGITAANGNWDEDFKKAPATTSNSNDSDQKRLDWIKFDGPGEYPIRLCGNFVKFYRWWSPFTTRIITHLSYKDDDPAWNSGFWPRKTFAIHVIDRSDTDEQHPTGKLKILEKGNSIFEAFSRYSRICKVNPASEEGPDFVVTVEWPKGDKRKAKYTVDYLPSPSPWTPQEMEMIKAEHVQLKKIYAPTPLEKIKEEWEKLPDSAKVPPVRDGGNGKVVESETAPVTSTQEAPPVEAVSVSDDDDLFGDNDGPSF
jgi:hypothetical protein